MTHVPRRCHRTVQLRATVMNLVTLHAHTGQTRPRPLDCVEPRLPVLHGFGLLEYGDQRQQTQARRIAVNAVRINQRLAQHLQASANSQQHAAPPGVRGNRSVQPLRAQPVQVSAGVLGAGQDDPVGRFEASQFRRAAHPLQPNAGHILQGLKLIQVADAWIGNDGNGDRTRGALAPPLRSRERGQAGGRVHAVFLRQTVLPPHRQRRHGRHASQVLQHLRPRGEQAGIAAKLVEHKAFDALLLCAIEHGPGSVEMRKGTAPINIGHQQTRRIGMQRHTHVDDIAVLEVDLGRRACAFDHHHVVFSPQLVKRLGYGGPHHDTARPPIHRRQRGVDLSHQHHLAVRVFFRLEQQRVHAHLGYRACGQGLEVLGATNFSTTDDSGVVAHVLRLERRDFETLARVVAAQRGSQPTFASAAGGT